jgi:hypothetical protein
LPGAGPTSVSLDPSEFRMRRQEFRRKRLRYLLKFATTTAAAGALLKRREEFRDCLKDERELRAQHRGKTRRHAWGEKCAALESGKCARRERKTPVMNGPAGDATGSAPLPSRLHKRVDAISATALNYQSAVASTRECSAIN